MIRKRSVSRLVAIALSAAIFATAAHAYAQWAPSRPVRLVVPFPPGGATDVIGRIVAVRMAERLAQQVVIDNRGGANAIIGSEIVAKAAPDGYTMLLVPVGHSITPTVTKKLPYDTLKDFSAIGQIGNGSYVLVVPASLSAKSVGEFIALAKSRAGALNYAVTGHGNATHLAGELFKVLAGIDMVGVYYKGGGPALTDLMGGQVSAFFAGLATAAGQLKAGKVRGLGVTTLRRAGGFPDIPTIAEAGVPGYEVDGWYGLLAPAATPAAVITRLNQDLSATVVMPDVKERLLGVGIDAASSTPAEFHQRIARDIKRWVDVVNRAKIAKE